MKAVIIRVTGRTEDARNKLTWKEVIFPEKDLGFYIYDDGGLVPMTCSSKTWDEGSLIAEIEVQEDFVNALAEFKLQSDKFLKVRRELGVEAKKLFGQDIGERKSPEPLVAMEVTTTASTNTK